MKNTNKKIEKKVGIVYVDETDYDEKWDGEYLHHPFDATIETICWDDGIYAENLDEDTYEKNPTYYWTDGGYVVVWTFESKKAAKRFYNEYQGMCSQIEYISPERELELEKIEEELVRELEEERAMDIED